VWRGALKQGDSYESAYGAGAARQLEEEFAEYVGSWYAVAVNTGGMALQMALRALGVEPGDEVLFQAMKRLWRRGSARAARC
jgi:dTDP-4-amino-4,6-dideoxygalactose transaminase